MPINISHIPNNASQTNRTNEHQQAKEAHRSSNSSDSSSNNIASQSAEASLGQDSVNLTHSAMRIKSLEAQIARLPIVDTQKVEQVKSSISEGTFEFDSTRVAEKLINFERDLL